MNKNRSLSLLLALTMLFICVPTGISAEGGDEVVEEEEIEEPATEEHPVEGSVSEAVEGEIVASGRCGDDLTWSLNRDGVLTISGEGNMYNWYPDDEIPIFEYDNGDYSPSAEWCCDDIKRIVIENGVTSIGNYAFANCYSLTDVDMADSIQRIGENAFSNCYALSGIVLPEGLLSIGGNAFEYCRRLSEIVIPDSVQTIGSFAFYDCTSLKTVSIGSGLKSLESRVFGDCEALEAVTIPATITSLDKMAFARCFNLAAISVETGNEKYYSVDGVVFTSDGKTLLIYPAGRSDALYSVPDGVTSIGDDAFYYSSKLEQLEIPDSVEKIGSYAFSNSGLVGITLPDSVTSVGNYAFSSCSKLASATIGRGLTTLSYGMFNYCQKLTSVQFSNTLEEIASYAFSSCVSLESIALPFSIKRVASYAFNYCRALTDVTYAGDYEDWVSVTVESGNGAITSAMVKRFGTISGTVSGFSWKLQNGELEILGSGALPNFTSSGAPWRAYGTSINHVTLSQGITAIGDRAFHECGNMVWIDLPPNLTRIGNYAFGYCSMLSNVDIPDTVSTVGSDAFIGCHSLKTIIVPQNVTVLSPYTFYGCHALENVTLPNGLTKIGNNAFGFCTNLEHIKIPATVNSIDREAFEYCSSLKSVFIPENVDTIETKVFSNCRNLETIAIPESVTRIYLNAFSGSNSISAIYYAGTEQDWNCIDFKEYDGYDPYYENYGTFREATVFFESDVRNGECGENLTWSLGVDGVLTVSGTGAMYDYESGQAPWAESAEDVLQLAIDTGITYIGSYAFENCLNLTRFRLPARLAEIAEGAFSGCSGLLEVIYDGSQSDWNDVLIGENNAPLLSASLVCGVPEPIEGIIAEAYITYIQLSWAIAEAADTQTYRVYRRAYDDQGYTRIKEIVGRNNLSYRDEGLVPGEIYYYYVVGVSNLGYESPVSDIVSASLLPDTLPPQVTELSPANNSYLTGDVTFVLTAEDNVAVTGAKLWYSEDGASWVLFSAPSALSTTATLDTTALADGELQVRGAALDAAGNESDPLTYFYMVDNTGPECVKGLSYESTDISITLHWDHSADDDVQFFQVERKVEEGIYETVCNISTISANITSLTPDTEYTYRVTGYDIHGNKGEPSEDFTARTMPDIYAPTVTAVRPTSSWYADHIDLEVAAQDEYNVAALTVQTSTDRQNWTNVHETIYADVAKTRTLTCTLALDVNDNDSLYIRAVARDTAGNESNPGTFLDASRPAALRSITALGNLHGIILQWSIAAEANVTGYRIYRRGQGESDFNAIRDLSGRSVLSYTDADINNYNEYEYYAVALGNLGQEGKASQIVAACRMEDTEKPQVTKLRPANNSRINGTVSFTVTAQDNYALGRTEVFCSTDQETWTSFDGQLDTTAFADGKLWVMGVAYDEAGLESDPLTFVYLIDSYFPHDLSA